MSYKRYLAAIILFFSIHSISITNADVSEEFVVNNTPNIVFTFPQGWEKNNKRLPYDLQYLTKDKRMNSAFFVYQKKNLSKNYSAEEFHQYHIDDLRRRRTNFKLLEVKKKLPFEHGNIIVTTFSADKNNLKNYYAVSVITLRQAPEIHLVSIQVSIPSSWDKNKPVLERILQATNIKKAPTN